MGSFRRNSFDCIARHSKDKQMDVTCNCNVHNLSNVGEVTGFVYGAHGRFVVDEQHLLAGSLWHGALQADANLKSAISEHLRSISKARSNGPPGAIAACVAT